MITHDSQNGHVVCKVNYAIIINVSFSVVFTSSHDSQNTCCISEVGITIIIVACVGIGELGTLNMLKHIFPACSGRHYKAKEIDEQANDPETVWINDAGVFAAPKALIGFNKGLAVAEYKDIAGISIKGKHHSKNMSYTPARGRVGPARALFYAFTDHYREWDTYYIIIRTRNHRRFVLTETAYKDSYESLKPILDERCGKVEYKIKGQ